MSTIQNDFDRIALVSDDGATHNDHYHKFLLRHLPANCQHALEIGCGTGTFSRRLASRFEQVLAIDLSPEMIRLARERSVPALPPHERGGLGRGQRRAKLRPTSTQGDSSNIEFKLADICDFPLPAESFDCIASIATLHHLPLGEMLLKMKAALKPVGVLLILDLFEPAGLTDFFLNLLALPVSTGLRLLHYRRLFRRREERDAWAAHEAHDLYPTMREVRTLCDEILPGARITKHLLWRYSIIWQKGI